MDDRKKLIFYRCWAFMIPALFFSMVTDTLHMAILGMIFSIVAFSLNKPIQITTRSVIYTLVIAFTLVTIFNAFMKVENRFHLTPSEIGVPAMLILSMCTTLFSGKPTITSITLILSIFAMMMNGDITDGHDVVTLPLPESFGKMETIKLIYTICLFLCIPPFYFLMNRSQNKLKITKLPALKWSFIKYILIILGLFVSIILYKPSVQTIVPMSRKFETSIIKWASQFRMNRQTKAFDEKISLKGSYLMNNIGLDTVLIRVKAKETPGYLRSRSYDFYHGGGWVSELKPSVMPTLNEEHDYTHSTFSFQNSTETDKNTLQKMNIFYSGNFKVNTLLHRGSSQYLELKCEGLDQTADATVSGKSIDFSGGLTLYNTIDSKEDDAYPGPEITTENIHTYLKVPIPIREDFTERFKHIDSDNPQKIAQAIVSHFPKSGFKYSLNAKLSNNDDPVFSFLDKKEGHCELYATTAVMILRTKGIPARYVTGFYCQEEHPSGNYFVGRSMDLHAWVEYYDSKSKLWRLMEPTPAGNMPQGKPKFNALSALWDNIANRWQELIANIVRGFFAESIILFLVSVFDFFLWFISTPLKALITLITLFGFLWYKKRNKTVIGTDSELLEVSKTFEKVIKQLTKIEGFSASPSTTLRIMIKFLEGRKDQASLSYAKCLKEYELVRYDKSRRSPENIKEIHNKLKNILKTRIR